MTSASGLEEGQIPETALDIMAQDVERSIRAKDLEVAVIGRQPLVEDLRHLDRPLVHEQPPRRLFTSMTSVAFDPHLHGTRLR